MIRRWWPVLWAIGFALAASVLIIAAGTRVAH